MGPEAQLERKFVESVRRVGGMSFKVAPTTKGLPDRMVLMPGGRIHLVELKAPDGVVSPAQRNLHSKMSVLGHRVWIIRSEEEIGRFLKACIDLAFHADQPKRKKRLLPKDVDAVMIASVTVVETSSANQ